MSLGHNFKVILFLPCKYYMAFTLATSLYILCEVIYLHTLFSVSLNVRSMRP